MREADPAGGAQAALVEDRPLAAVVARRDLDVVAVCGVQARASPADELLRNSLTAVLPLLVEIGTLERDDQNDLTSRIRLLKVVAALTSIERSTELVEQTDFFKATAKFTLQGQLEVTVALDEPEPEGLIEQIHYELDQPTARSTTG